MNSMKSIIKEPCARVPGAPRVDSQSINSTAHDSHSLHTLSPSSQLSLVARSDHPSPQLRAGLHDLRRKLDPGSRRSGTSRGPDSRARAGRFRPGDLLGLLLLRQPLDAAPHALLLGLQHLECNRADGDGAVRAALVPRDCERAVCHKPQSRQRSHMPRRQVLGAAHRCRMRAGRQA